MLNKNFKIICTIVIIIIAFSFSIFSEPGIPKNRIPADIPEKVLEQIIILYTGELEQVKHAIVVIGEMKEDAVRAIPFLITMLDHELSLEWGWQSYDIYDSVGRLSAEALATIGEPAIPALVEAFKKSDSPLYRYEVIHALSMMKSKEAQKLISMGANDKSYIVRLKTVVEMGKQGKHYHFPYLISRLNDENQWVRRTAVQALGEMKYIPNTDILINMLRNKDYVIRGWAAESLGKQKVPRAINHLVRLLADETEFVQNRAFMSLIRIGRPAVPKLNTILQKNKNPRVQTYLAGVLTVIGDYSSVEPLMNTLDDEDAYLRAASIRALGKIGARKAIIKIKDALTDEDRDVRKDAAETLARLGWKPKNDEQRAVYFVADRKYKEAGSLGKVSIPYLQKALQEDTSESVKNSIKAILEKINNKKRGLKPYEDITVRRWRRM